MTTVTVCERDRLTIGGPTGLSEHQAAELARLAPALPPGAVTWEHRAIRFGPFCGVLHAGGLTIEILPKVGDYGEGNTRGVLVAMLKMVGELSPDTVGTASLADQERHLLDVFILDFCARVNDLLRRGAIRRYEPQEENLTTVRGRIQLAENTRRNPFDRSRLVCCYDELSPDNVHNRALKFVLGRLLAHALGTGVKTAVNGLLRRLEEVADRPCNAGDVERLPFDRLTRPWQSTFARAAWLLRGLYPDVLAGKIAGVCLLFNMERLFEAFVGAVLRRQWRGSDATVVLQGSGLHFARASGGLAFGMRPDATVIAADKQPVLIADAKWKRLNTQAVNAGVGRDDIYQMAAYAGRYRCRDLALLYPSGDGVLPGQLESFAVSCSIRHHGLVPGVGSSGYHPRP